MELHDGGQATEDAAQLNVPSSSDRLDIHGRIKITTMIRSLVLIELKPTADLSEVAAIQEGFRGLNCPGTVSYTLGDDLGLKEGNWSFGICADFADEESYRGYDLDQEHNRLRAQLAPHVERVARAQYALPDHPTAEG